MQNRNYKN